MIKFKKRGKEMADYFNYEEYVKECRKSKRDVMISNRSIGHAAILITNIVEEAEEKICLLTGSCDDTFYAKESIKDQFLSFIKKSRGSGEIEIIFEKREEEAVKCKTFVNSLYEKYKEFNMTTSLSLSQLKDNSPITNETENQIVHFIVVDNTGPFRFEKHSLVGRESTKIDGADDFIIDAKANFGNINISHSLQSSFDKLKKYTNPIPLPLT